MQHNRYWSCSKFGDWVRGTPKLPAGTSREWNDWTKMAKEAHPIRYYLAEETLGHIQDAVNWPREVLHSMKYYINNRWVTRSNALTAHREFVKPGDWQDLSHRILPCLFSELVDFVEIESAWIHIAWGDEPTRAKYKAPFWSYGWFRWRTWRCAEAGIDHLNWAAGLVLDENMGVEKGDKNHNKPTGQAEDAREILALYRWWKEERPKRPDPHDASGWTELSAKRHADYPEDGFMFEDRSAEEKKETRRVLKLSLSIEAAQEKEDTEMMIRLIKVRHALWT